MDRRRQERRRKRWEIGVKGGGDKEGGGEEERDGKGWRTLRPRKERIMMVNEFDDDTDEEEEGE